MNGPEHYREAERLLALAESTDWTTEQEPYRDTAVAAAQAHATLAHVAAIANHQSSDERAALADAPTPWSNKHNGDGLTWDQVLA
jgi:hypothetical protein